MVKQRTTEGFDPAAEVRAFEAAFAGVADPERAVQSKRYLKSPLDFVGVTLPIVRSTARAYKKAHPGLPLEDLRALVRALWETPSHELRLLGIALLELHEKRLEAEDADLVEALLRASTTWDHVDWLSTHVMGGLVIRFPELRARLVAWSKDEVFWIRRASMLSLLLALRKGGGDFELFRRLAGPMVEEKEFFIRKAIGWVLREVSKTRPELTESFLSEHLDQVSGLTLREGAKYLPAARREALLTRRG